MPSRQRRERNVTEHEVEMQRQLNNHEARIASLEAFRDNQRASSASAPAWIVGILSAGITAIGILVNYLVAVGR